VKYASYPEPGWRPRVGQWVRYSGPNSGLHGGVGQVLGVKSTGFTHVSMRGSKTGNVFQYGCSPIYLHPVGPAAKAIEIACRALKIKGEPVA
jgi:hypothetical protein